MQANFYPSKGFGHIGFHKLQLPYHCVTKKKQFNFSTTKKLCDMFQVWTQLVQSLATPECDRWGAGAGRACTNSLLFNNVPFNMTHLLLQNIYLLPITILCKLATIFVRTFKFCCLKHAACIPFPKLYSPQSTVLDLRLLGVRLVVLWRI